MTAAPGPTLETVRLILRPMAPEDLEPWAAFVADPAGQGTPMATH